MKTDRSLFANRLLTLVMLAASLTLAGWSQADEMADPQATHYVIKVTPTLAYIDVGQVGGAMLGSEYIVLRADADDEEMMIVVGEVRVLRVYAAFSIAEITSVEPDEEIGVLQRVMPRAEAMGLNVMPGDDEMEASPRARPDGDMPTRSLVLMGGMDLSKGTDLSWGANTLMNAEEVSGPAVAIRLGRVFAEKLRLALTYRLSGEPLGPSKAEVTQLSAEVDAHILLRGAGRPGPYIGFGGSIHLLTWDAPNDLIDDSAYKTGFNILGGLEIPIAKGRWSLFAEGGYQGVTKWASMLDASHTRAYVGLGRNF